MSWIREPESADRVFDGYRGKHGVDHIVRVHGLSAEALAAHMNLYKTLMFGASGLTRAQREMIAVVVSEVNGCRY